MTATCFCCRSVALLIAVIAFLASGTPASAQTRLRPYAGGSVGSFSVSADASMDGRSPAGLFGGWRYRSTSTRRFEVGFRPITFTRSYTGGSACRSRRRVRRERRSSVWA